MRHFARPLLAISLCSLTLSAGSGENGKPADQTESAPPTSTAAAAVDAPAGDSSAGIEPAGDVLARGGGAWKQGSCAMCHGADGHGDRFGPDLTDNQWDHGDGLIKGIRAILVAGISKDQFVDSSYTMPMPPATQLVPDEEDLVALATYVKGRSSESAGNAWPPDGARRLESVCRDSTRKHLIDLRFNQGPATSRAPHRAPR
jgi:mono/diheme cytochrome c family protein